MEKRIICGCLIKYDRVWPDGRSVQKSAFKDQDGDVVPMFSYNDVFYPTEKNAIGQVKLEEREDGMYYTGELYSTPKANKELLKLTENMTDYIVGLHAINVKSINMMTTYGKIVNVFITDKFDDNAYIEEIRIEEETDD